MVYLVGALQGASFGVSADYHPRTAVAAVAQPLHFWLLRDTITPTSAAPPSSEAAEGVALLSHWRSVVEEVGACALPGVSVKYDTFIPCMWKAVARGFVPHEDAVFVGHSKIEELDFPSSIEYTPSGYREID